MAGAGYKLFNTGDVLTAAQVNTYLQEQTVMVFADATARTTALSGVLAEGMVTYLKDTNAIEKYTGAAWVNIDSGSTSPLTTKGDLYTYSTTDARLAVGNNGDTLVADSSQTTGLRWGANYGFTAGKNKIINGDCNINQRAYSSSTTSTSYIVDRFQFEYTGGTTTGSVQSFTAGTAPVTGYEARQFIRLAATSQSAAGDYVLLKQKIESVRTLANQTATLSFWAKAGSGTPNIGAYVNQVFGSGGSAAVTTTVAVQAISTSWARYSFTINVPSISGKTIGTGDYLEFGIMTSAGATISGLGYPAVGIQNATVDLWGFQIEAGSVATAFQTATGTLAGELAACQRYYFRTSTGGTAVAPLGYSFAYSTTATQQHLQFPVTMRVNPSTTADYSGIQIQDISTGTYYTPTGISYNAFTPNGVQLLFTGMTGLTTYRQYTTLTTTSAGYLAFNSEL